MAPKNRALLDTTVLVAGSAWPRWPYEVLLAGLRGECQLVICRYVIEQARRVLERRFPQTLDRFDAFLASSGFEIAADPTREDVLAHAGLLRDPTDIPVLLAAVSAGVDYLVSEDKDLTQEPHIASRLGSSVEILLPGTFLRQVLGWSGERLEGIRKRNWKDIGERMP